MSESTLTSQTPSIPGTSLRERLRGVARSGYYAVLQALGPACVLIRPMQIQRFKARNSQFKVIIGAGSDHPVKGWLGTDIMPSMRTIYVDARKRLPFAANSVDYIFSEHMIEHVPHEDGRNLVREIHRVLKPGAKARIATPDLVKIAALGRPDLSNIERDYVRWSNRKLPPALREHAAFTINGMFRSFGHQFLYDEQTLACFFREAGFADIERCEVGQSEDPELRNLEIHGNLIGHEFNLVETMVLEARKPAQGTA